MSVLVAMLQQLGGGVSSYAPSFDLSFTLSVKDLVYLGGVIGAVAKLHASNLRVMREHTRKVTQMEERLDIMWRWFSTALERRRVPRDRDETR